MVILRNLAYGKNRLQEIIMEETEEMCKDIEAQGVFDDILHLLK